MSEKQTDKDKAKQVDIIEYLKELGYEEEGGTGSYARFMSPFGNDRNPSFMVKRSTNRWTDYTGGDSVGGDIIDLVMKLEQISFKDAIKRLLGDKKTKFIPRFTPPKEVKKGVEIIGISEILDCRLIDYLEKERKIPMNLANKYCDQLSIKFPNSKSDPEQVHVAIGFMNNECGYEIRNSYLKIAASPKTWTTIKSTPKRQLNVFEGFISFLSTLVHFGVDHLEGTTVIMNTLSFYTNVIEIAKDFPETHLYLDYGQAGHEKTMLMRSYIKGAKDCRDFYKGYEDSNDLLTGKRMK